MFLLPEKLFALDIGTRSVVGIILEKQDTTYEVKDILSQEHTERAMLDGQIHDVLAVSKVIMAIKNQLEEKHGPLKNVSVAAAGRALKTERAIEVINIKDKPMIQQEDILHLELCAVQQAQAIVAEKMALQESTQYFCVGYSVLFYRLDGQEIGNLIDQSGYEASVEIIATFLPKVVVESLAAALKRAELHMQALTLEPIAAINVLIPTSMRRLNVALVDIGAGTSDIALTDSGTVIAYGMVPVAGDEITEAISDQLLLDFPLAEEAKKELGDPECDSISVTDILGFTTELNKQEVIKELNPAIEKLAHSISNEILTLNNSKAPKAVMLIGGGSLTPELPIMIAEKLSLPSNRVAIRGIEAIQDIKIADHVKKGPELVTPIGIAIAAHRNPIRYLSVMVNGKTIRLFDMKRLTVADCLLTAGIRLTKLFGKPGMAQIVQVNGQPVTIPGKLGGKPILTLNGVSASLDDPIKSNDEILIQKGLDAPPIRLPIRDLLDHIPHCTVNINNQEYSVDAEVRRNGFPVSGDELIADHDTITCMMPPTISALLNSLQLKNLLAAVRPFTIELNQKQLQLPAFSGRLLKNGTEVKPESSFTDGDTFIIHAPLEPRVIDLAKAIQAQLSYTVPVSFNGKRIILSKKLTEFYKEGQLLKDTDRVVDGDSISFIQHKMEPFIFQDLFRHVEIDMPKHSAGRFVLIKNNQETSFHETLASGDELKILWPTTIHNKK